MDCLESLQLHDEAKGMSVAPADADGAAFRMAMREFASGVAIVTCGEGEARSGCTVTALTSLSLNPPSLVVCISRGAATLVRLRERGAFVVNVLGAQHQALADRFAGRGGLKGPARFSHGDWGTLITGAPLLRDALAGIDCRVEDIVERHSHAIVIGAVVGVRRGGDGPALAHWRSRYETLA
jgi:flavin reductase (DIM6/NTAB) family NADH-FMN oxidoreductase RutF